MKPNGSAWGSLKASQRQLSSPTSDPRRQNASSSTFGASPPPPPPPRWNMQQTCRHSFHRPPCRSPRETSLIPGRGSPAFACKVGRNSTALPGMLINFQDLHWDWKVRRRSEKQATPVGYRSSCALALSFCLSSDRWTEWTDGLEVRLVSRERKRGQSDMRCALHLPTLPASRQSPIPVPSLCAIPCPSILRPGAGPVFLWW